MAITESMHTAAHDRARWRWPRSATEARAHAVATALVLWVLLIATFTVGAGDRSFAGPLKGADFVYFYTIGTLARTHQTQALYDFDALHRAQVALVPESDPEFYPPVYPPHAALLFAPVSLLPYRHAMLLWNLTTIVLFALIVRSAGRPVSDHFPDPLFVVAAAAAFPPFWNLILHGQATIVVLAAFWAGWRALEQQRRFLAGMAFGLLLFKPQFAIPLAVIVLASRDWRMAIGASVSIAIQTAIVVQWLGWSAIKAFAALLPVMLQHADLLEPKSMQSHSLRTLTRLAPPWAAVPLWGVLSVLVLAGAVLVWKSNAPLRARLGMVILAAVLVNPHLIVYDATVLVLPLLWCGAYVLEHSTRADAATFWTGVYWLFVVFLAPTAVAIGVQVSVLLMVLLVVVIVRTALRADAGNSILARDDDDQRRTRRIRRAFLSACSAVSAISVREHTL
jgi:alpha-1,2-mannosyltransferase